MPKHDPFLNHVRVLRSGIATEEAITTVDHHGPNGVLPDDRTIGSLCLDGIAIHLTVRQSKALRKVLKALEGRNT